MLLSEKTSEEYDLFASMYITFKYKQNYVSYCLTTHTNMFKLYGNKKDHLKIQESGDSWGMGIWKFTFLLFFKIYIMHNHL